MDLENIAGGHDKNKINLEFLLNLLKKKKFTGFISIENGEVIMMNGRICYSQYKNHFGENALYIVKEKIATPREVVVKRMKMEEVLLKLKWLEIVKELPISDGMGRKEIMERYGIQEPDREYCKRMLKREKLLHLLKKEDEKKS